jgi:anti-sigma regulatory factor (Ser/Thr protein kinase)
MTIASPDSRDEVQVRLEGGTDAATAARRALDPFQARLEQDEFETLRLLVSELVTNSVRHADASTIDLWMRMLEGGVRVEVRNAGVGFDTPALGPDGDGNGGWGLLLVDRLADSWGVGSDDGATRVWLEIRRH